MKRFSEQFNKKAQALRMEVGEKRELRERLFSYMEYHPLPTQAQKPALVPVSAHYFHFTIRRLLVWTGSFLFLFVASIPYLAEYSVPGDALYAVKIEFNEELRSTMARSPYEKVVWQTELLNRRIAEAKLLANEGKLTEAVEEKVTSAVKEHRENARQEIENLKLSDKDEAALASIELSTNIDVQTTSLINIRESNSEGQLTNLIETIKEDPVSTEEAEEKENLPSYNRLIAKVESETLKAHELLTEVKTSANENEQVGIKRRLDDIEKKVVEAIESVEENETAARKSLVSAVRQIHSLIVFMSNIDVRRSVTVDEIVPVTLTDVEKIALIKDQSLKTEAMLKLVDSYLSATTSSEIDTPVLEEAQEAMELSSTTLKTLWELLGEENPKLEESATMSQEAYDLALSVLVQLKLNEEVATTTGTTTEEMVPISTTTEETF